MASWFEKNIARPVKDFLRGSGAVQKDQNKADAAKVNKMIADEGLQRTNELVAAQISAINENEKKQDASSKDKSISEMLSENQIKINVDTDQGKRYVTIIGLLIGLYLVIKVLK